MRSFVLLCILSISFSVAQGAQKSVPVKAVASPWKISVFATPEWRYERDSDLDLGWVSALGFGVGLRKQSFGLTFETFNYKRSSGNSTLSIEQEHRDWMLGLRYYYLDFPSKSGEIGLYVSGGIGVYTDTVRTTLSGVTTQDKGDGQFLATAGLGAEANVKLSSGSSTELSFGVEGRILASKNFDPNPEPGILARIGLRF